MVINGLVNGFNGFNILYILLMVMNGSVINFHSIKNL